VALDKHMRKNKSAKRHSMDKASRVKHQICYTYHDKDHLSKNCPKTQTFIYKVVKVNKLIYLMWNPRMTLALPR
jgi:hypothetical protein